jgi:serine/threonine protein kinase
MALTAGTKLGPYEIQSQLGAGGMGEVYKAKDTRLDRTVAIKVLPSHLSDDPELRRRFEREARAVSNLNHPHICTLHDIGQQEGTDYIVMEYLEGETLADRLRKGVLPVDQVLQFGIEIADALDGAHRQGIVHRDLKPGNIMLTQSGAKLLDFGLAKLRQPESDAGGGLSGLATQDQSLTGAGTILGTFQYMAPEQLEGKDTGARTDIFAFGAVLYEMATGKKAFGGESRASLISAIMSSEPEAMSELQPMTPPALEHVVKRCLAKDPEERWASAHDVMLELKFIVEGTFQAGIVGVAVAARTGRERLGWLVAGVLLLTVLVLSGIAYFNRPQSDIHTVKVAVLPPPEATSAPQDLSISPDGNHLAFVTSTSEGKNKLWVRSLDSLESKPLSGAEGGSYPFWSPDSRYIGFFADGKLKKIEARGGLPQTLSDANNGLGGTWSSDGVIVFTPAPTRILYRVSAAGGEATPVTALNKERQENSHRWPQFLPDGHHFLFFARSPREEDSGIYLGSLGSRAVRRLLIADHAVYVQPGFLLYVREGALMALPFDAADLRITGDAIPIAVNVGASGPNTPAAFTISGNGVLAYGSESAQLAQLTWYDRNGVRLGAVGPKRFYRDLSLSRDEKQVAVDILDTTHWDIWLLEFARGITSRVTSDSSFDMNPVWSADGNRIVFNSNRNGVFDLFLYDLTSAGAAELLYESSFTKRATDWSSDGRFILFERVRGKNEKRDLVAIPVHGDHQPMAVLDSDFDERQGQFSPDGRWVAFASDESGRFEVYIQSFPKPGRKWQISTEGGSMPKWRSDGRELFYIAANGRLMAVGIEATSTILARVPNELFEMRLLHRRSAFTSGYSVSADGNRFLVITRVEETSPTPITVVLNWAANLER